MATWHVRIADAFEKVSDLDFPSSDPSLINKGTMRTKMENALQKKVKGRYQNGKWYVVRHKVTKKLSPAFVPHDKGIPQFTSENLLVAPCPPYCSDEQLR